MSKTSGETCDAMSGTWRMAGLVLALSLFANVRPAAAEQEGDLLYTVVGGNQVRITGYAGTGGPLIIPPEIGGLPVTQIGGSAFSGCGELTGHLSIPDSVTDIGNSAFMACTGLTGVTIGNGVVRIGIVAFQDCAGLTGHLTVPDSVTEIEIAAFQKCRQLSGLTLGSHVRRLAMGAFEHCGELSGALVIPDSVTDLGRGAFINCSNLTSVAIGKNVTSIPSSLFEGCGGLTGVLTIPDQVGSIGYSAFYNCSRLTGVVIGNGVVTIDEAAFYGCKELASLTLGAGVRTVGGSAFTECERLAVTLTIPASTVAIGDWAFYGSGLTGVTGGPAVTEIGRSAFSHCPNLASVEIGASVADIGPYAFAYCPQLSGAVTIPDSVTELGMYAFNTCSSLTSVVIGSGVKNISAFAFGQCRGLTALTIRGGVTNIGTGAFIDCVKLAGGMTLPDSVRSIGVHALSGCNSLTNLIVGSGVEWVGEAAFSASGQLAGLYFKGIAPAVGGPIGSTATVYHVAGRAGWGANLGERPTAVWTRDATFDAGAGAASFSSAQYEVGKAYQALPTASLLGHAFLGWRDGAGGPVTASTLVPYVIGAHTLYASWEAAVYAVTFDAQGGAVTPAFDSVTFGEPYGALPEPARLGYAFGGWWTEPGGGGALVTAATVVETASDHTLYAKWTLDATQGPATAAGMAFELALPEAFAGAAKIAFKGLPAGLKYNAATRMVSGVPTKAGTYSVTLSATGVTPLIFTITVEALPVWAQGAFNGYVEGGGLATMTVSAVGKVTGKLAAQGTNYAFTALSYAAGGSAEDGFTVAAVAKAGKAALPLTLAVTQAAALPSLAVAQGALAGTREVALWRDAWKSEAAALAPFIGYYTATLPGGGEHGSGYLTFTVDKAGKVKVGGKLADGTAVSLGGTLILDGGGTVFAAVYTAPAAYKGGSLFGLAEFVDPAVGEVYLRLLDGEPFLWQSRNPQATEILGEGFARATGLSGGWYSKTANLAVYFAGKNLAAGVDPDAPAPELTVGSARYDAICWDPSGVALTPTLKAGVMAGLAAPAAGKPTDVDKDGEWDYGATNAVGLKCTLTRATGVFKGSFLAWFDYPVKKHVSKSLAFEGALTPVRENPLDGVEGRGYFLWADKAMPPLPAKPYAFKWSYDFLIRGE